MTAELTAHELFAPTLIALVDAARAASARVEASFRSKRGSSETTGAIDPEALHDFRVALRRLRTLLRVARKVYGKKHMLALEDGLRVGARATGTLRDEEVLRETLGSLDVPKHVRSAVVAWQGRRARQERAHRGLVVKLLREAGHAPAAAGHPPRAAHGEHAAAAPISECLSQLRKRLEHGASRDVTAASLGRKAVGRALRRILKLGGEDPSDPLAMHALRIRFKRLRYAADLFEPVLGEHAALLSRQAARMQKRLGELHDVDEALVRIGRAWGLAPRPRAAVLRALRSTRRTLADRTGRDLADLPAALEPALALIEPAG